MRFLATLIALPLLASTCLAAVSERRTVEGEEEMTYFLIRADGGPPAPEAGYKLLLVLPGGDGSADFNPFVQRIHDNALGDDYLVAQLVSVKWTPEQRIVWPTKKVRVDRQKFTTEEFIEKVVEDVAKQHRIDKEHVYTLSWSSSGPAAYAASLGDGPVKGSYVAMSVFKPDTLPPLRKAKEHRYFIDHSPDDRVCPFRMAEEARDTLAEAGAKVKFNTYAGGHGWRGDMYGRIATGMKWLEGGE